MHIIKITPKSFKIILTKDELVRGKDDIPDITDEMLKKIITETNRLYDNPFAYGTVDAEFFASKDGGGELFISKTSENGKDTCLCFVTDSSDNLSALCHRLSALDATYKSTLYLHNENYTLVLADVNAPLLEPILHEYGKAEKVSPLRLWIIDEHAHKIIEDNAVSLIAEKLYPNP